MAFEDVKEVVADENKFLILKGRFKSNSLSFYGLLLLIFNARRDIEVCHALVSTYSSVYENETHYGWEKYQEFIVNAKWKGNFNPSMSTSMQDFLNKMNSDKLSREQLYEFCKNYDYDNINKFVFDIVNRIINDKNLILETGIQEVTASEYKTMKEAALKSDRPEEIPKGFKTEDGSITLPIKLILAPVSGKPIYELKIGDKIMTKIVPSSDRANYYIDLLNLRVEDRIKPLPSTVTEIKSESREDPLEILVQLAPGIYGSCMEDERQVKLRMYDPSIDGAFARSGQKGKDYAIEDNVESSENRIEAGIPKITLIIGGLLALIFLFLILFILYL